MITGVSQFDTEMHMVFSRAAQDPEGCGECFDEINERAQQLSTKLRLAKHICDYCHAPIEPHRHLCIFCARSDY